MHPPRLTLSPVLALLTASLSACDAGKDGSDSASTDLVGTGVPPVAAYVSGSRLSVDAWTHGDLALPHRLRDTRFDQPCAVEAWRDSWYCLPYVPSEPVVGSLDEGCSEGVVLGPPGEDWAEGSIVVDRGLAGAEALGVYRVGAAIDDGEVLGCYDGVAVMTLGTGARYALSAVDPSELVEFVPQSASVGDGLELSWLDGADGAKVLDHLSADGGWCQIIGDSCVPGGSSETYTFAAAFTDADCTDEAYYPQMGCDGGGYLVSLMNECREATLLGLASDEATGPAYRRLRDGSCAEVEASGGWFGTCLQSVVPALPGQIIPLHAETRSEGDLELVSLSVGDGLVVDTRFQLPGGTRCEPGETDDGQVRCVPQRSIMAATDSGGGGGLYTTVDVCEDGVWGGEALYTFLAGEPCSLLTYTSTAGRGEPPQILSVSEFVPYEGDVYEFTMTDDGYMECPTLDPDGFWVPQAIPATTLPTLSAATL